MPSIDVTDEQAERLRDVQEELAAEMVGRYGHVRPRDALEYLLDRHEGGADAPDAVAGGAGGADGADADESERSGGAGEESDADEATDADDGEVSEDDEDSGGGDGEDDANEDGEDGEDSEDDEDSEGGENDEDGEGGDGEDAGADGGDDARLDAMMRLLDTHDDRWSESSAADERYAVELPDGDTEHVRTKDDVRALLFRHYR